MIRLIPSEEIFEEHCSSYFALGQEVDCRSYKPKEPFDVS